jgi:hypothetical protein
LHAVGYRTVGFAANPFLASDFGFAQGFDSFQFYPGPDFAGADRLVADATEAARTTQVARPLFVWVHMMEPHSPYTPPPLTDRPDIQAGRNGRVHPRERCHSTLADSGNAARPRVCVAAYDEEIAAADAAFDMLIREVRSVRQSRDAVMAVTADHGEQFLEHAGWEHSSNRFDELIRVPLGLEIPGVSPRVIDAQVQVIDLFPTLLELAGADVPPKAGQSLAEIGPWGGPSGDRRDCRLRICVARRRIQIDRIERRSSAIVRPRHRPGRAA